MGAETHGERETGLRNRLKRVSRQRITALKATWRQRIAKLKYAGGRLITKLWQYAYKTRQRAGQLHARYGKVGGATVGVLLMAASLYMLPALQTLLAARFGRKEGVQSIQSLLVNTGSALIGATAIVTSLVLFAMQVNVERMPHGLFRHLSEDRKLLWTFTAAFVLAIGVTSTSTVVKETTLACVVASAVWAILLILISFLYA